ncbi:MAG: hypothetical protein OEV87_11570 [Phycisphaerae bacterium]|nr:hypothetical protein [Phycisphaerae bacterium]
MKTVGTSIAIFGGLTFLAGIVFMPILDSLTIDPIALILFCLGMDIRRGSRTSIKWPAILCGWYIVICAAFIVLAIVMPEKVEVGKYNLARGWPAVIAIVILLFPFIWNAVNLWGLLKYRKKVIAEPTDKETTNDYSQFTKDQKCV